MDYFERKAAAKRAADREDARQAWLASQRHKVEPYPERLTGPSLAAAVTAATTRPADPKPLTGHELIQEILGRDRYHNERQWAALTTRR